ncbi:Ku protein [Dyella sp.]|uniref:non-homologous end joining protein Ku n=1 Tax=Dyella sp. TaxID=1869338 RepID=UPI002ECFEBAA
MARPIWSGTLSFGLLNVPVSLMSGQRATDLHFRMLDSRNNTPVRYERLNADTGEEVPWKDIVKAFEYKKGNYVVLKPEDIASAAPDSHETVEVESFVDADSIGPEYFEKPYVLVPGKKAEKGYVLLREILKRTHKIGIAKVVIRTRQYLSAVIPKDDALMLVLMRYPQELIDAADYPLPAGSPSKYRISSKEMDMAQSLIQSMSMDWNPEEYIDEFRGKLQRVIEKRLKSKGVVTPAVEENLGDEDATTNVVDFMALLQQSLNNKHRTPAKKSTSAKRAPKRSTSSRKTSSKHRGKRAKTAR